MRFESVLLPVLGIALIACSRIRAPDDGAAQAMQNTPCPLAGDRESDLVGNLSKIPEYHDCQKLASGNPAVYGPLVGIFVTKSFAIANPADSTPDSTDRVKPRAVIFNFGPETYRAGQLNFPAGYSCVWLNSAGGEWSATITFAGTTDTCSRESRQSVTLPATHPERPPEPLGDRDYPRVARWQWDPVARHHYFGIKCGSDWCQFGGSGETQPTLSEIPEFTPIPTPGGGPDHPHRVKEVMGWYDQQDLADVIRIGSKQTLQPTVMARIFPHPQLEQMELPRFADWVQSAFVYMSGSSKKYEDRLNLPQGYSEIALCQGDNCPGLPLEMKQNCAISSADAKGETARKWFARIRPVGDATETNTFYHCVVKQQHPDMKIPGTARWRWSDDDEKIWIRCTNGCCTVV